MADSISFQANSQQAAAMNRIRKFVIYAFATYAPEDGSVTYEVTDRRTGEKRSIPSRGFNVADAHNDVQATPVVQDWIAIGGSYKGLVAGLKALESESEISMQVNPATGTITVFRAGDDPKARRAERVLAAMGLDKPEDEPPF